MSKTSATFDRRSMPVSAWPEQDRSLWQAACEAGGPLDDAGAAADWAPATRRSRAANYGRWLTFLDQQDLLMPDARPGDRVTPDMVRSYIDLLRPTLAPLSLWTTIDQLAAIMPALAPDADWGWLRRTAGRLKRGAANRRPITPRIRNAADLYQRALAALSGIDGMPETRAFAHATAFRDALMIALTVARPIRRRTLAGLRVGQHLRPTSDGFLIQLESEDLKCGGPMSFPLPASLAPHMARYLDHHRPRLLQGHAHDALWITREGLPMTLNGVSSRFERATPAVLGERINPHLLRHCAATSIALDDPQGVRLTAALLGHSTLRTSERHYTMAKGLEASRRYQTTLTDHITHLRRTVRGERP
ncbi:MAG: tyrosine-type recombinase/integrase [Alphaproteobacteria bacterium]